MSGGLSCPDDPHHVRLADLAFRPREYFLYEYDFTDTWQHDIRVEQILALDSTRESPVCIGGRTRLTGINLRVNIGRMS